MAMFLAKGFQTEATRTFRPMYLPSFVDVTSLQAVCFTYPTADVLSILTTAAFIIPEILKLRKRAQADREKKALEPAAA